MTTITLPPDLESRLAEEATRRGTTLEGLAVEGLQRLYPAKTNEVPPGSLYDLLAPYIGAVDGSSEALSENCGERFTDYLVEKKRQGKL